MRLWTLNPKYLDTKGLVALWRETLLAKKVLEGNTRGYKNHPQLNRFKPLSIEYINTYLYYIHKEATSRGYNFDSTKFNYYPITKKIPVSPSQVSFERNHLNNKLAVRDVVRISNETEIIPIFEIVNNHVDNIEA